ncbi:MAG TPA: hypothetical protein VLV83_25415 [Acidobacteriota bacterium]|nr:hypothetical protein [Acidobacteriota bacterium]
MSGVIRFGTKTDKESMWFCSGWCFRGILDAVIEKNRDDDDLVRIVQRAKVHNGLHLERVAEESSQLARRIREAIESAALNTIKSKQPLVGNARALGADEMRMYRRAVAELLEIARNSREK